MAVLVAVMMAAVAVMPFAGCDDSDAATEYWTYTVTSDGKVTGSGSATASPTAAGAVGTTGKYTSLEGSNVGSWGFDTDGYGPFGSFYAAFDACHGNKIICHLDPDDLTVSVDGNTKLSDYSSHTVNIMWVLPTIYWSVNSSGNLVLSNDSSKGTAYAHTIDDKTYPYLAIGVYEASTATVDNKTVLTSTTGDKPLYSQQRSTFRTYANNNTVATEDGTTENGHAMLWNLYMWQLYRFSVLTVGGGWNSQGIFGNGDVYGGHYGSYVRSTGDLDTSGPYAGTVGGSGGSATNVSGKTSDGTATSDYHSDSVKVFIEDAWGSLYDFVDGVVIYGANVYATQVSTPTNSSSDYTTMIGTLPSSSGYGSTTTTSSTNAGFWGLPTGTSGSETSGLFDYIYSDTFSSSGSPYGLFVGGCSGGDTSGAPGYGLSYMDASTDVGVSFPTLGGRLALVFDADPASISTPTATLNHAALTEILNDSGAAAAELTQSIELTEGGNYPNLGTVNHCEHIGWEVNGKTLAVDASFDSLESHEAKSLWKAIPYVTFDHTALTSLGGSASGLDTEMTIESASTVYPDLGTKDGYTHAGWYVNGTFYSIGSKVVSAASHTAYSAWMVPQITITFVVEDKEYATLAVQKNTSGVVFTPKMVTGVFEGWYTDSACTVKYDPTKTLSTDTTLYAKGVPPLVFTSVPTATASIANVTANMYYFDATDSTGRYAIEWDFGDGNTSTDPIAYNTYTDPGHYTVTLKITNLYGDTDTKTYGIDVGDVKEQTDAPSKTPAIIGIFAVIVLSALVVRRFV